MWRRSRRGATVNEINDEALGSRLDLALRELVAQRVYVPKPSLLRIERFDDLAWPIFAIKSLHRMAGKHELRGDIHDRHVLRSDGRTKSDGILVLANLLPVAARKLLTLFERKVLGEEYVRRHAFRFDAAAARSGASGRTTHRRRDGAVAVIAGNQALRRSEDRRHNAGSCVR